VVPTLFLALGYLVLQNPDALVSVFGGAVTFSQSQPMLTSAIILLVVRS